MRSLLSILMLGLAGPAIAQSFSLGVRGGAGYWFQGQSKGYQIRAMRGEHITADAEVFARWSKKSWALEAGLGTSGLELPNRYYGIYIGIFPENILTIVRNWEMPISLQRELRFARMNRCPQLKGVHTYIGITVTPSVSRVTDRMALYGSTGEIVNAETKTDFRVWTGLNNTIVLDLTKKLKLQATGYFRIVPGDFFSTKRPLPDGFDPVAKAGAQFGLGYGL